MYLMKIYLFPFSIRAKQHFQHLLNHFESVVLKRPEEWLISIKFKTDSEKRNSRFIEFVFLSENTLSSIIFKQRQSLLYSTSCSVTSWKFLLHRCFSSRHSFVNHSRSQQSVWYMIILSSGKYRKECYGHSSCIVNFNILHIPFRLVCYLPQNEWTGDMPSQANSLLLFFDNCFIVPT